MNSPEVFLPLTRGHVAVIDFDDFEKVRGIKWFAQKQRRRIYAARNILRFDGGRVLQLLHSFLMPGVPVLDHKDGNGLNNRRENLRPATNQQNHQGFQRKQIGASSTYRGVSWHAPSLKWRASITVNGKSEYLGLFSNPESAARAYDSSAREHFGEFASPNFPN